MRGGEGDINRSRRIARVHTMSLRSIVLKRECVGAGTQWAVGWPENGAFFV